MMRFSEEDKKRMIDSYFKKFYKSYSNEDIIKMSNEFGISRSDKIMEMYASLGVLANLENPYIGITNLIEKEIGLNKNILEVGGGIYPALAQTISNRQIKIGNGTITVYDPLLGLENLGSIHLVKESFTNRTDISKYDLIIGKEPCMATFDLIENSKNNNKEFVLSICKCIGLLPEYYEYDENPLEQWYQFVEDICTPYNHDFSLFKHNLSNNYKYDNPIFVYKKNK